VLQHICDILAASSEFVMLSTTRLASSRPTEAATVCVRLADDLPMIVDSLCHAVVPTKCAYAGDLTIAPNSAAKLREPAV
jgi:hypothetical protein